MLSRQNFSHVFPSSDCSFSKEWEFKQRCIPEKGHEEKIRGFFYALRVIKYMKAKMNLCVQKSERKLVP